MRTRVILLTLAVLLVGIWTLAVYAGSVLREEMRQELGRQELSNAASVAATVDEELRDRLVGLELVGKKVTPTMLRQPQALQALMVDHPILLRYFNGGVVLLGPDGTVLADSTPLPGRVGNNLLDMDGVAAALHLGQANVGLPTVDRRSNLSQFGIAVPLRDAQGHIMAAMVGITYLGAENFLDAVTDHVYGSSGGYLLVAPQIRSVVTATDRTRTLERLPPPGANAVMDRFIAGFRGTEVFVAPNGIEVLASAHSVNTAGWYLAAILPTAEAFAPIAHMQWRLFWATCVLTVVALVLTRTVLRLQLAPLWTAIENLDALAASDHPPMSLPIARQDEIGKLIGAVNRLLETLAQREGMLQQVLDTSSVAIFVVDRGGIITQANERMAEMFGVPVERLVGAEYVSLVHPQERDAGRTNMLALLASHIPDVDLDRQYWRGDQTQFWGHLNGRRLVSPAGEEVGLLGVIADVTARVRVERLEQFRSQCLECIARGDALDATLAGIAHGVEQVDDTVLCSLSMEGEVGLHSRGTLVHDEPVIWEQPVVGTDGQVLGALRFHRGPGQENLPVDTALAEQVAQLAAMAIQTSRAAQQLQLAANVFAHAREAILITEANGSIIDVNQAFTRITGYSREEVVGRNPRILNSGRQGKDYYTAMWRDLSQHGYWYGEVWNRRKNGEIYAEMQTISAVRDAHGMVLQYVAVFSDITVQKEQQAQLERIAHFDALTGLPNRVLLADRMHQAMAQALRRDQNLAVVFLDLDGFKAVNDNHGHDTGDQLLVTLAQRMRQALRDGDTVARIGGDEFVAVLADLNDSASCQSLLNRLLDAAAQVVRVGELDLQVSASLGVTFFPQSEDIDADTLLRQADQAMYQAKIAGRNRFHIFDAEHDRNVRGHHESLERIRRALAENEFVLHYQPKVNMRTGQLVGAEALIRWQHPQRGLLAPAEFLPVIEDHPLAIEVGEWVIGQALAQLADWRQVGIEIEISVNLGASQLQQLDFVPRLQAQLARHPDVPPHLLVLEVLETSALEDIARVSAVITTCAAMGVRFALDDFGTGYSSLTYLKRLPASTLKIDQSFVRGMLNDPDDLAILDGVIGLAIAFRREVIAEGVETEEHGTMLLQLGCELAQGYGIARPMPAAALQTWILNWRPPSVWAQVDLVHREDLPLLFALVEHRAWLEALEQYLQGGRATPPELSHEQCHFGGWLRGQGGARHGTHTLFSVIDALHRDAHAMATHLCMLKTQGLQGDALAGFSRLQAMGQNLMGQVRMLEGDINRAAAAHRYYFDSVSEPFHGG